MKWSLYEKCNVCNIKQLILRLLVPWVSMHQTITSEPFSKRFSPYVETFPIIKCLTYYNHICITLICSNLYLILAWKLAINIAKTKSHNFFCNFSTCVRIFLITFFSASTGLSIDLVRSNALSKSRICIFSFIRYVYL